ncbi:sensor histidine kinase [Pelagibius marinus]|uniref:sensor histidine kinase n=1 Tax=Pelagibius marinus TaxID=2762760 RepID=UPI001872F806|nr:HAMP domain-containing sensor histidine kinase [Pelagibius marinus]
MTAETCENGPLRRFLTVSNKLAALGAIGVSIGFVIVIWVQNNHTRSLLYETELQDSIRMTEVIAAQLYGPLRWRKPSIAQDTYDSMITHRDLHVVAAVTLDRQGNVVTTYQQNSSQPFNFQELRLNAGADLRLDSTWTAELDGKLVVATPVTSHDGRKPAGTFVVAWSLAEIDRAMRAMFLRAAFITIVLFAAFTTLSLAIVHRQLSDPLTQLTQATTRIANGDKTFEIPCTDRRDEVGDMARALVTFRENVALIDRLTAEQQQQTLRLSNALEKEREYNALHREFVSMVSHEFRTPVAIIDGAAQRIERRVGKDTEDQLRERTGKIRSAVVRMIELIDSTLSVSRMEAGTIELEAAECDFAALLREVCQRQQEIAKHHKIDLTIADLPSRILIDAKRMDQVLTNLLSNAVKYAPDAPDIAVKAGTVGRNVVVSVRDRGLGIPEAEMPKLFEKFFRASTSAGIPGTGIGLHLVKHLVELHDGNITVDSTEGKGSTFSVTIPTRYGEADAAASAALSA